jgi:hypothetical protein
MRLLSFVLCAAAAFAGVPFWEAKAPADWSDAEIEELLTHSPWAQEAISGNSDSGATVFIASARPIREAEAERNRREFEREKHHKAAVEDPTAEEYADFLRENEGKYIVLAVPVSDRRTLAIPSELKRMEQQCVLRVGKKKYRITGHFPPSPSDGFLRLVFPRAVTEADRTLRFELYIPAVSDPYRFAEFRVRDMMYKGRLEL